MQWQPVAKKSQIAVWGGGYLGYGFALKLQQQGITPRIWVQTEAARESLLQKTFPPTSLKFAWSRSGTIPSLDLDFCDLVVAPQDMFTPSVSIHIIAIPNRPTQQNERVWMRIAGFLREYLPGKDQTTVILAATPVPGDTEAFIRQMGEESSQTRVATAFRTDWFLEDFIYGNVAIPVGGDDQAVAVAEELFGRLKLKTYRVGSHYEAEVFSVSVNSLEYLVAAFVNQMSMAHPACKFHLFADLLWERLRSASFCPSLGVGGRKTMLGLESLFQGTPYSDTLGILKEAQTFSMSLPILYADWLSRRNVRRVGILGITPQPDNVDLSLSPSLVLGEALLKRNIQVYIHDPYYNSEAIAQSLIDAEKLTFDDLREGSVFEKCDAIFIMTPHRFYLEFTQDDIDNMFNGKIGFVIDNGGIWSHMQFSNDVAYHVIGRGTLDVLS